MTTELVEAPAMLNTTQAAEYLSVSVPTLETWRCLGRGPRYCKVGRLVRYRVSDLEAYIESRTVSSTVQGVE